MSTSWKQQALIEAPVEEVWELLQDPTRFPEWGGAIEVTGVPTAIEKGSTFQLTAPGPFGKASTTTYKVEEFDNDLREIKLRCQFSGFYSCWRLTEARGDTFADIEVGKEPQGLGLQARATALTITKGFLRRVADQSVDGLQRLLGRR